MARSSGIFLVPRDPTALEEARGGRSYAYVADRAGISRSFLCDLCRGVYTRVTPEMARRIEDALGVPHGTHFMLAPRDEALLGPYLRAC